MVQRGANVQPHIGDMNHSKLRTAFFVVGFAKSTVRKA